MPVLLCDVLVNISLPLNRDGLDDFSPLIAASTITHFSVCVFHTYILNDLQQSSRGLKSKTLMFNALHVHMKSCTLKMYADIQI